MAGLLAWAADVVGGNESGTDLSDDPSSIPLILNPQQQQYLSELNYKAAFLNRSIEDLRLRIPPSDIAQQQREAKLLEENAAYEKEITNCQAKTLEKSQEAEQLQQKLKEIDLIEENLKAELQKIQPASTISEYERSEVEHQKEMDTVADEDAVRSALLEKLESKKKELQLMEEKIQTLEKKWEEVQEKALRQPSAAEALVNDIHVKEKELERLNATWKRIENTRKEGAVARNRFPRSGSSVGFDSDVDLDGPSNLPYHSGGRSEYRQRLRLLRSSFVLYVFLLHIIVFIRISFI
ncbi:Laminin subunit alpha-2 [Bienertia sinuspersici]